ncbi:MAG: prepilin peptidase [Oscillospiraceae bacterium]|nr:prepilin peptidase [Oscillospiraceae bacterium]
METVVFEIIICFLFFALGAATGSFLNVVIMRSIKKESFTKGRSHCPFCAQTLKAKELIPIFSFLFQGGRCRNCKEKLSFQYPIVETLTAFAFVWAYCEFGLSIRLAFALILFAVLIELSVNDHKTGEIPYHCSIIIAGLGVIAFVMSFFNYSIHETFWYEHIIGLFIISVPFMLLAFFGAMGGGDVHLMAAAGLLLGWAIVPSALIGFFVGAIAGVIIKLSTKSGIIRFGPYLSIGIAIGYVYGKEIIEGYKSLLY